MFRSVSPKNGFAAGLLAAAVLWPAVGPSATSLEAASAPRVDFDIAPVIECHELAAETGPAAAETAVDENGEKVIVAAFRVSVLLREGSEADIEQLMITLVSPARRLRVLDFQPRTELVTDVVGEVETVNSKENEQSLSASIGGAISGAYGPVHVQASPSLGGGNIERELSKETYRRLPEKKALLVSGTTNYEHGVFFKLKPSPQASLEGTKDFACQFVVPASWRADWAVLSCQATTRPKSWFSEKPVVCGEKKIFVGLYLSGDAHARDTAWNLPLPSTTSTARKSAVSSVSRNPFYIAMRPFLGPLPGSYPSRQVAQPSDGPLQSHAVAAARGKTPTTFQSSREGSQAKTAAHAGGLRETLAELARLSGTP